MIKTVFLDMDGVLVNFLKGLHKALDAPYSYDPYPYKKGLWNMLDAIEDFDGDIPTFKQCDDCCNIDFWTNLKWMHDGKEIFSKVVEFCGINNIYLLTTPMPNPGSGTGKILWVEKNIPVLAKQLIITQASKSLLARSDTLLIDDRDKNVDEFIKAGGKACLVPRPWNRNHFCADRTVEVVEKFLKDIK